MLVKQATPGKAFDVDQILNAEQADDFIKAGYGSCIRYFPLNSSNVAGCLTGPELQILLGAGLAVGAVQHVDSPPWSPTAALGTAHGAYCAAYAKEIGYAAGGSIYCDLEEVAAGTTAQQVIDYCNNWFDRVQSAGFTPGLYCGWNIVLTAEQLYYPLKFKSYWKAYNYDNGIAVRGFQIVQHPQETLAGMDFDPNTIGPDDIGGLPMFLYPS
jgi:hypothetical protein